MDGPHPSPEDLPGVLETNARANVQRSGFTKEYRLKRRDGAYRWMLDFAVPRIAPDGTFSGFIGSAVDITERKLAQEGLEKLSGKLIEAQEQERSRIARELQDDISQRLALLSMELERVMSGSTVSNALRDTRMMDIRRHCEEIAADVQALSHELHSSRLDYLGLVPAIKGFCAEFSTLKNVVVDFTDESVPNPMPKDVSLCLFRVTQEALHNALKHSGTKQFTVSLRGEPRQVRLEIKDLGAGFDIDEVAARAGLGLVSMQERVHMVKGIFHLESRAGAGTIVVACVPRPAEISGAEITATSEEK